MRRRDRLNILTIIKRITFIFIGISAVCSSAVLFLWIFGLPGTQNGYARGWELGLYTLFHYVVGCVFFFVTYVIGILVSKKFQRMRNFNLFTISIFWIFFLYSAFNMLRAFYMMFSAS
ncbi:hypothetical protein H6G20_01670 [Desertifilum sp. FACHB-1129]|uniref:Uncharacterized protein n=2 Tax=Desertifilum tharense IPPAS B-1220 TaxID=1781255 RepID=A0A1E5QFL1_9CYAN|nr:MULTISPECIES: hypothetical protein [Desertifilum]MDA0208907.1 hypothetical protein [Cyanobacteria bacterium FC1]MBD2310390.1 hypothetical protein [Desertifilum sp. FACHB-1129]MBD2321842.1 hypothetical protein [Desertifilum sp. FACHB-866]MBD2331969.1 hypothetical protein [Desertifilum sp. FACHB-868]OEJ73439.1 hypothetical protein BH720_19600 [Desertifilum tharense IPPAS B-1220]